MSNMTKKHVLALAAAGAMMLGATAASAQSTSVDPTLKASASYSATKSWSRGKHRAWRHHQAWRSSADHGPFGWPGAAVGAAGAVAGATVAGAGYAAGSVIGAPAGTFRGGPYDAYASGIYGVNPYADAARAQHYETPIGNGSIYTGPVNGLPMGPQ